MVHAPFSVAPLIRPDVLGAEPVTAALLYGASDLAAFPTSTSLTLPLLLPAADRIVLGTERGTLLIFDLSRASSSSGASPHSCLPPTCTR